MVLHHRHLRVVEAFKAFKIRIGTQAVTAVQIHGSAQIPARTWPAAHQQDVVERGALPHEVFARSLHIAVHGDLPAPPFFQILGHDHPVKCLQGNLRRVGIVQIDGQIVEIHQVVPIAVDDYLAQIGLRGEALRQRQDVRQLVPRHKLIFPGQIDHAGERHCTLLGGNSDHVAIAQQGILAGVSGQSELLQVVIRIAAAPADLHPAQPLQGIVIRLFRLTGFQREAGAGNLRLFHCLHRQNLLGERLSGFFQSVRQAVHGCHFIDAGVLHITGHAHRNVILSGIQHLQLSAQQGNAKQKQGNQQLSFHNTRSYA